MIRLLCPSFPGKEGIVTHWSIEEGAPLRTYGSPRPIVDIQIGDADDIMTIMMVEDPPLSLMLKEQRTSEGESLGPGALLALIGRPEEQMPDDDQVERLDAVTCSTTRIPLPLFLFQLTLYGLLPALIGILLTTFVYVHLRSVLEKLLEGTAPVPSLLGAMLTDGLAIVITSGTLLLLLRCAIFLRHKNQKGE